MCFGSATSMQYSRGFHRRAPFLHCWSPSISQTLCLRHDVRRIESGKLGLVRWHVAHSPEKSTLRVWLMCRNVQRTLVGLQPGDYTETWFIHRTFGLFGIFQCDPDLITDFWMLVFLQIADRLGEIVFKKIEESGVVVLGDTTVP